MQRQHGFTVIEVTLFLGFTAMLFLVALFGTGAFVAETRFGDGMRRLESYMQAQYEEVVSGVNPRPDTVSCNPANGQVSNGGSTTSPGASQGCILLGKLLLMDPGSSTVTSHYVIGVEPAVTDTTLPVTSILQSYNPKVEPTVGMSTYDVPWGLTFISGRRATAPVPVNGVAFLRSPVSSQVLTYVFSIPNLAVFGNGGGQDPIANPTVATGTTAVFCFRSADNSSKVGAIQVFNGQGSTSIAAKFEFLAATTC